MCHAEKQSFFTVSCEHKLKVKKDKQLLWNFAAYCIMDDGTQVVTYNSEKSLSWEPHIYRTFGNKSKHFGTRITLSNRNSPKSRSLSIMSMLKIVGHIWIDCSLAPINLIIDKVKWSISIFSISSSRFLCIFSKFLNHNVRVEFVLFRLFVAFDNESQSWARHGWELEQSFQRAYVCSWMYATVVVKTFNSFIVLAFDANQQDTKKKRENGNNTPHQLVNISCFCFVNAHKIYYPFFCHCCRCIVHKLIILCGEICIYNWSTRRMTKMSSTTTTTTTTVHKTLRKVNYFHWRNKHRKKGKNVLCDKQGNGSEESKKSRNRTRITRKMWTNLERGTWNVRIKMNREFFRTKMRTKTKEREREREEKFHKVLFDKSRRRQRREPCLKQLLNTLILWKKFCECFMCSNRCTCKANQPKLLQHSS